MAEVRAKLAPGTPVEIWFQDEMRVGQKNKLTYRWARKGSRPRAAHDQRTQSTYLFGAVCPEHGTGAALVLPFCNTKAMQLHLDEISARVTAGAHAILILDQAGWHGAKDLKIPRNLSLLPLPPRAPELNPQENIWQTVCSLSVRMWLVHAMRRARVASDRPAPSLTHRGRAMQENSKIFVGLDTSKMKISVALAEEGRQGEVRFLGDIDNTPDGIRRLVRKLTGKFRELLFCYEAGPTGYGLHRQITALGHSCSVIAPSLIPKRPGEHVKTNRRDAVALARLHRAGELTTIWVPDPGHEAIRDLVRAREAAMEDLREKRQQLQSFLLRHGRIYPGLRSWTLVHARWLSNLTFEHPAQYLVLREYRQAIEDAEARLERLTQQVADVVSTWSMAPVVEAYQAMRGVAFLTAVTFVAEIGDVRRFETPRQLMAYLGLVPSERSTGEQVRRGSITKAGNPRARRVLIEGAWTYRYPARLSRALQVRQERLPKIVRAIAWKAQVRLCARYRRLMAAGKRQTLVTTAIAREMAAFLWAIGHEVVPSVAA